MGFPAGRIERLLLAEQGCSIFVPRHISQNGLKIDQPAAVSQRKKQKCDVFRLSSMDW